MSMPQVLRFSKMRNVMSPCRSHQYDAGIDFYVPTDYRADGIEPGNATKIASGIKANIAVGMALVAFNKSGVATKHGLQVGACVVDAGYEGEIHLHVMNVSNRTVFILPNTKLVQFLYLPIALPQVIEVEEHRLFDVQSQRGDGGFGSTDDFGGWDFGAYNDKLKEVEL
jgi:dUTP pyrophosphatase